MNFPGRIARRLESSSLTSFYTICIPLFLAIFLLIATLPFSAAPYGDGEFHWDAKIWADVIRGNLPWDQIGVRKALGPVLFYTVPYIFVPSDAQDSIFRSAAVAWTMAWIFVAFLCICSAAETLGGRLARWLAAGLFLSSPFLFYYCLSVSAEPAAAIGAAVFAYGWTRGSKAAAITGRVHGRHLAVASLGMAFVLLCRPNAALMLPLAALCVCITVLKEKGLTQETRFSLLCAIIAGTIFLALSSAAAFLPGSSRGKAQSENFAYVFFHGRFQYRTEPWNWNSWDDINRRESQDYKNWLKTRDTLYEDAARRNQTISAAEYSWIKNDIIEHPALTLQMAAIRTLALHVALVNSKSPQDFKLGPFRGKVIYILFHIAANASTALLLLLSSYAIWFWGSRSFSLWPLWGLWVSLIAFHIFIYAEPRYLLPGRPGITVLAAVGAAALFSRSVRPQCNTAG